MDKNLWSLLWANEPPPPPHVDNQYDTTYCLVNTGRKDIVANLEELGGIILGIDSLNGAEDGS